MTDTQFDRGLLPAVLHFVFGAFVGAALFGLFAWLTYYSPWSFHAAAIGALIFGCLAAIWREKFWSAFANNPLFRLWRFFSRG